jgi:predicted metalloprotease
VVALAGALVVVGGLVVLAVTVSQRLLLSGGAQAGNPLAAERIDLTTRAVPIAVVGAFGAAGSAAESDPLANSADGDRAVAAVLADLQDFWNEQLRLDGRDGLRSLAGGYVSMDSTAASGRALCITDPAQIAGNAFYCPGDDGIVFDSSALVPVLLGSYGSAGLAAAFAHEFGHAVQAQVGPTADDRAGDPGRYPSVLVEAQADCAAGAFLAWASNGAAERVHIPPWSLVRAVAPLLDFRDPATVSRGDPVAHGLGLDRLTSLLAGFRGGPAACPQMSADTLPLTLGREGVTTSPPSTLPRFAAVADALAVATTSVTEFAGQLGHPLPAITPEPADLELAAALGQFAAASAVALAAGRAVSGGDDAVGAACFTGAWAASVFGHAGVDELGSWPTDADEAMDLIRARPGVSFAELGGYADGFERGWAACS